MNKSLKAVLGVVIAACVLAGLIAWMPGVNDDHSTVGALFKYWCPLLALLLLAWLVWGQLRKDKAPNFLLRVSPRYFERDGFCFAIVPEVQNGQCFMRIYFQNRHERPCTAQILIRATSGLFSGRPDLSDVSLGVSCAAAEFGCATIPWFIPAALQGKALSLSLYAGVRYPQGRGRLLRYRDGLRVGSVGLDTWREGLQIAGALVGSLVISRPARISLTLPSGVASSGPEPIAADTKTLWKLGDPIA